MKIEVEYTKEQEELTRISNRLFTKEQIKELQNL